MNGRRIAIYGKGGIGKTTIAVNLAVLLARRGLRTLLVGCDPKKDTARLLTSRPLPSLMERYDALASGAAAPEEVLLPVRENLLVCESGGPRPGVGCAGRGILIALEWLQKSGAYERADVVLYDVLGDVVCGGFATPVTRGFTDTICVVTSGEQASLLAANNILRGMEAVGGKVGGLIFNARGFDGEERLAHAFAQMANTPLLGEIPCSQRIKREELRRRVVCEAEGAEAEKRALTALAERLLALEHAASPRPLDPEVLYAAIEQMERCDPDD